MKGTVVRVAVAAAFLMAVLSLGHGVPGASAHDDDKDNKEDNDKDRDKDDEAEYVYAVKVICPEHKAVTTSINVHNPNRRTVRFAKKGIALKPGQEPTAPCDRKHERLKPDWALQMSCDDIEDLQAVGHEGFGDVIIESKYELDVWAVYLTGVSGGNTSATVLGTDVVRVPATRVKKERENEEDK